MNKKPKKLTNNIYFIEEENHYKNNGELYCQWCYKEMTEEDHPLILTCDDCRDEVENELAQV